MYNTGEKVGLSSPTMVSGAHKVHGTLAYGGDRIKTISIAIMYTGSERKGIKYVIANMES